MKQISFLLDHPDAHFFDCRMGERGEVYGQFEAGDFQTAFDLARVEFLEAAWSLNLITEYPEGISGDVWVPDSFEGFDMPAIDYIREALTHHGQDIIREAFRLKLERELFVIRKQLNADFPADKLRYDIDADFCAAAIRLAELVKAANMDFHHIH
jgi:hypothetical protein